MMVRIQSCGYINRVKSASQSSPQEDKKKTEPIKIINHLSNTNMFGHKILILALVAGILMMQFSPVWTRKTKSDKSTDCSDESTSSTDDSDDTAPVTSAPTSGPTGPQVDPICLTNFIIAVMSDLVTSVLGAVGACLPCDQGVGACIACIAEGIPEAPPFPEDCIVMAT